MILIMISCTTDDNHDGRAAVVSSSFYMIVENDQGENLLDPTNNNAFDTSLIKLFKIENGQR